MRRIAVVGALALGVLALLPVGARAGGVESLKFRRPYYSPGDSAAGRTSVWFESAEKARMAIHGRFVAYLLPEGRWFRPPGVPEAAVPLGPVTFSSPDGNTAIATLEFTVPDVPDGDWSINVCNQPCTDSMIGDLIGGSLRIAHSPEMAAVLRLEERLTYSRQTARFDNRRNDRQVRVLREQLDALGTEVGLLEDRLARRERTRREEEPSAVSPLPASIGWILVTLTVLFGVVAFRPRRKVVLPPEPPAVERIENPEREAALRG